MRELLDADPVSFATATEQIDSQLQAGIEELQQHRRRIAQLGSSDTVALPEEVADYLDRLRSIGAPEVMIAPERDAWILVAARWPERIPQMMADKIAQLGNPKVVRLYQLLGEVSEDWQNDTLLHDVADLLTDLFEDAAAAGQIDQQTADADFTRLLDAFADETHPVVGRLRALIAERGWEGWTAVQHRER